MKDLNKYASQVSGGFNYINEAYQRKINWVKPDASDEHNEVHYQLTAHSESPFLPDWAHKRLSELKDKHEWNRAINSGKIVNYSRQKVENTGNTGERWSSIENDSKKLRAPTLYGANKKVQRPIVLKNPKTGDRYLIAGHHRISYVTGVLNKPAEVHEIV